MRCLVAGLVAVALLCWPGDVSAAPVYPLKISPNERYFVDQAGVPVLLHGDTAWSLIGELTKEEAEQYLDDCVARKFNSLIITSPEGVFATDPPTNAYGDAPFTTPGDFTTPNEAYFQHADWVIQQAAARGIQILLSPCYLGFGENQGWLVDVRDNNTEQEMRDYGVWIGNRYKDQPNLMFIWGNDVTPEYFGSVKEKIRAMAEGLRSVDGVHLMTYHASRRERVVDLWDITAETWLDFNNVYQADVVWPTSDLEYAFTTPTTPFILFESWYENSHGTLPKQQRVQAYHTLLSGGCGHHYGNGDLWPFGNDFGFGSGSTDWQAAMADPARLDMMHVRDLFESREWWKLVPDTAQTVLTAGHSTGTDRATCAMTSDKVTIIIYAPSQRTLTVDMDELTGTDVTAWWFNPRDGSVDAGTPLASSGSQNFTPPTNDDWVLVIDDTASLLPPPGTGTVAPETPNGGDPGAGEPSAGGSGSRGSGCSASGGTGCGNCTGGGEPYVYTCSSSAPEPNPSTPWCVVALGAWVLLQRSRTRRGA